MIEFKIESTCGKARAGTVTTTHGEVPSPFFMPVGTLAAVKGVTPAQLREAGANIVLSNTYHLALRPGEQIVRDFGGVADFMGWHGPTLTDSGGYQVYSLADIRKITDEGVRFKSHIDGSEIFIGPERSIEIQQALGADIIMAFDECPPGGAGREVVTASVARTQNWAERCKAAWSDPDRCALFGIVQGGLFDDLRQQSAEGLVGLDLPGYAIGGVSVGEPPEEIARIAALTTEFLPKEKPRYLMGVGTPQDILRAVGAGIDMFDCVMPTRHARHAQAFTLDGRVNLKNARWKEDHAPIEEGCDCYTCRTISRGYLRHLFVAGEMLGPIYAAIHNIRFYLRLMEQIRKAILDGTFETVQNEYLGRLEGGAS